MEKLKKITFFFRKIFTTYDQSGGSIPNINEVIYKTIEFFIEDKIHQPLKEIIINMTK